MQLILLLAALPGFVAAQSFQSSNSTSAAISPSNNNTDTPTTTVLPSAIVEGTSVPVAIEPSTITVTSFGPSVSIEQAPASSALPTTVSEQTVDDDKSQVAGQKAGKARKPTMFMLSDNFTIAGTPKTRRYQFEITESVLAPDGWARPILLVNGQFPGPLIEANEGDTIEITVQNKLSTPQSLHWHGMIQKDQLAMDGAPGITQCPIPAGGQFTYKYTIQNQFGTYWWHSHYGNTMADGLLGGLIVHSPNDPIKRGRDFDEEMIVFVSDWMHDSSEYISSQLSSSDGYHGTIATPAPDSVMINGIGQANCTEAPEGQSCETQHLPEIHVPSNKRIRMRFINPGSHALLRVSVDEHPLRIVEVDSTPVDYIGGDVHQVPIAPAQRMSGIIDTTKGENGDAFWLRAAVANGCIAFPKPMTAFAVLRYVDKGTTPSTRMPATEDWFDIASPTDLCTDLDEALFNPKEVRDVSAHVQETHVLSSVFGKFVKPGGESYQGFGFNNITFVNKIYKPILREIAEGRRLNNSLYASATFNAPGGGNLVVINRDPNQDHPYHLHGEVFAILARGSGVITAEEAASLPLRTNNPLRRDVIAIPRESYAVLRVTSDYGAVLALHCHIGWHFAEGKFAVIVTQPNKVKVPSKSSEWAKLCSTRYIPQGQTEDSEGPARRRLSPKKRLPPTH